MFVYYSVDPIGRAPTVLAYETLNLIEQQYFSIHILHTRQIGNIMFTNLETLIQRIAGNILIMIARPKAATIYSVVCQTLCISCIKCCGYTSSGCFFFVKGQF